MKNIVEHILKYRFNFIDIAWLAAFCTLVAQKQYLVAFLVAFIGGAISAWLVLYYDNAKDKPWKRLMDQDRFVDAIRMHRQTYNSTLKDAKDIVDAYRQRRIL